MLLRGLSAALLSCVFFLAVSHAAVFERDWKSPGDGLLTYDNVNEREWLDLTETQISDFSMGYDGVVAELAPSGLFEGFAVANSNEVTAFAESAGIDTTSIDFATNEAASEHLINLLGSTIPSGRRAIGWTNDISTVDFDRVVALFSSGTDVTGLTFQTATSNPVGVGDRFLPYTGVMLFRQVPEPSAILFAIIGVIFISQLRKQANR